MLESCLDDKNRDLLRPGQVDIFFVGFLVGKHLKYHILLRGLGPGVVRGGPEWACGSVVAPGPAEGVCGILLKGCKCENTESQNPGSRKSINQDREGLTVHEETRKGHIF